jgi:hypothetical protein
MRKWWIIVVGLMLAVTSWFSEAGFSQTTLEKVLKSPDGSIHFENPPDAPLIIEQANTKVITRAMYGQLVGFDGDQAANSSGHYTTYPTVTVYNNTNQVVTSFTVFLERPGSKRTFVKMGGIRLEPNQTYTLERDYWRPAHTSPDMHKSYMWLPGDGSDLKLILGIVEFEDRSRWMFGVHPKVERP